MIGARAVVPANREHPAVEYDREPTNGGTGPEQAWERMKEWRAVATC